MKLQEFVDGGFYINLDHREDKNGFMVNQLKNLGLHNLIERFSAVAPFNTIDYRVNDPEKMFLVGIAASISHKTVIQIAKNRGYRNVLVLEDDALFYNDSNYNAISVIESALDELSEIKDWDVFYLGADLHDPVLNLHSNHLIKCECCTCAHAYIINSKSFDSILNKEFNKPFDAFDLFLNNNFKNKYVAYPAAVLQKGQGISDIGGHVTLTEEYWLAKYKKEIKKYF